MSNASIIVEGEDEEVTNQLVEVLPFVEGLHLPNGRIVDLIEKGTIFKMTLNRGLPLSVIILGAHLRPLHPIPCFKDLPTVSRVDRGGSFGSGYFCLADLTTKGISLRQIDRRLKQIGYLPADLRELCDFHRLYGDRAGLSDVFGLGTLIDDPALKNFAAPFIRGEAWDRQLDITLHDNDAFYDGDWQVALLLRLPDQWFTANTAF